MLPLPAGREASAGVAASVYERNCPKHTHLYQLVEEHCRAFATVSTAAPAPLIRLTHQASPLQDQRLRHRATRHDCTARIVPTILLHFLRPWRSDGAGTTTA